MDEIAGRIDEEVVMQIGRTKYEPQNARYFDFIGENEFKRHCREARIVVSHGAMVMMDAIEQRTPVIAVPRLKKYREHIDDHQVYIVQELEKQGKIKAVYDINNLEQLLIEEEIRLPELTKENRLIEALRSYINKFDSQIAG
jgi:UDP-N-acetylglucosamine transferase subunit ALG13